MRCGGQAALDDGGADLTLAEVPEEFGKFEALTVVQEASKSAQTILLVDPL